MFTATRTISMSHWQQFSLAGPHVANTTAGAMKLYDVDGDGCNELILGLTDGWLAVYKDNQLKASTSVNDTITAVTCGYLQALDTTAIVTMTTTGQVYFHGCTPGVNTLELLDRVPFHVNVKSFKLSNNIQPNATVRCYMLIIGRVDRIAELVEITAKPASTPVGNSRAQHMFHGHRLSLSIVRREALKHQVRSSCWMSAQIRMVIQDYAVFIPDVVPDSAVTRNEVKVLRPRPPPTQLATIADSGWRYCRVID
eukprot:TRINITY_DN8941_c0_g1_i2.p2 TRINITY_DN8941_c0_g1~~TRINITY_DN8941_c0_g1_i2.p2  ORF type:complete len:254 (+),score=42.91 TRINITY_DN8941_c0_g1_i2:140-901(+)